MTAIRLNFIVEGQTEEAFVNTVLRDYLASFDVLSSVRCVETSRRRNIKHSGGIRSYAQVKRDIERWLRSDANAVARFTTMFDLYALPSDFPGYADAAGHSNPYDRIAALEDPSLLLPYPPISFSPPTPTQAEQYMLNFEATHCVALPRDFLRVPATGNLYLARLSSMSRPSTS